MYRIPLTKYNDQRLLVDLDNQQVRIRVRWSPLSVRWYLDLAVGNETITNGRLITTEQPLISDSRLEGEIMAFPIRGSLDDPGYEAWGDSHDLFFITLEELGR